jgi:hypothetical protein
MDARVIFLRLTGCAGLLLSAAAAAQAAAEITSPFLPSSGVAAVVQTTAPIELHGYMMTPEGEKFSIYDPAKKTATWVKLNEMGYPFVVRSYKQENSTDQVTVDYQGTRLTLALKQSKIASAAPANTQGFAGRAGVIPGNFGPRAGGAPGAAPAAAPAVSSAQEAARLQAAAIDFQQRQLQRQQAAAALQAQQAQQAAAGQVQPAGQRNFRGNGGAQQQGGGGRRGGRGQQ